MQRILTNRGTIAAVALLAAVLLFVAGAVAHGRLFQALAGENWIARVRYTDAVARFLFVDANDRTLMSLHATGVLTFPVGANLTRGLVVPAVVTGTSVPWTGATTPKGALWYNDTTSKLSVWTGAAWTAVH